MSGSLIVKRKRGKGSSLVVSSQHNHQRVLSSWRRQWHPTPVLLPGKSHGRRSLEGCSPWGRWGSDTTERLHFHFSLSCIGEGNGNPLQCSCLENPRDGGAWWAAVSGVAQSRTRLKWLSSSSSVLKVIYLLIKQQFLKKERLLVDVFKWRERLDWEGMTEKGSVWWSSCKVYLNSPNIELIWTFKCT